MASEAICDRRAEFDVTSSAHEEAVTSALDGTPMDRAVPLVTTFRRGALIIMAIAAVIQAAYLAAVWSWSYRNGDAIYFQGQAGLNAKGHWFVDYAKFLRSALAGHGAIYVPSANHPPLTSGVFTLADVVGLTTFREHSVALGCIFVAAIGLLALALRGLVGPRVALLAALLAATDPYLFVNTGTGLAETLVLIFVIALLWAVVRLWQTRLLRFALLAGALVSLCAQTRAELGLLVPTVVVPAALVLGTKEWRPRLVVAAVALVGCIAVSAPWVIRNQVTFTNSVVFSDEFGTTLADSNCPATYYGHQLAWWFLPCWTQAPVPSVGDESVIDAAREHDGLLYISHHKLRALEIVGIRELMAWNLYAPSREVHYGVMIGRPRLLSTLGWLESYVLLAFAGLGAYLRRRDVRVLLIPLALIVTGSAAVAITFASQRYLVEAQLGVVILAACGISGVAHHRSSKEIRKTVTQGQNHPL